MYFEIKASLSEHLLLRITTPSEPTLSFRYEKPGPQKVSSLVQDHLDLRLASQGSFYPSMLSKALNYSKGLSNRGVMTQSHCTLLLMARKVFLL